MGYADLGSREIIGRIYLALEQAEQNPITQVGMLINSDQEIETYRWLSALPAMREWLGGRHLNRMEVQELVIRNKKFEASLEVMRSDLARDKTDQIQLRANELAVRANSNFSKLLTEEIEAGTTTNCYDGTPFFGASHSEGDSGTQDNDLTAVAAADTAIPTADEFEAAAFEALSALIGFKDAGGEPLGDCSEMTIMVPVKMFGAASKAMTSSVIATNGGVRDNGLVNLAGYNMRLVVNPRLTSDTTAYFFNTGNQLRPYILQSEETPRIESLAEGSDFAFENDAYKFGVSLSQNVAGALWQYAVRYNWTT